MTLFCLKPIYKNIDSTALFTRYLLSLCLSTIDMVLMLSSNTISFVDPVTGKYEINFKSKTQEIKRANE
ncbi:hypothetical protein [Candidatus Ruthturnera calyptogenae]|uniref:hypothetical protein n=1 Tax=Candidatus Ruthturnera calyptogenae TaxID=386487 RepID=UPI0003115291|nr:hypothetical protein [Candidatus Ruthturnera calyptogenae]